MLSALLNWLKLLYRALYFCPDQEKYMGRNSSNVIFSWWADFAQPLARTKTSQKACAAMLFLLFTYFKQNAGGEDFNQFLMDISSF